MENTNPDEKKEISGTIEKISYKNSQNGYTVCTVRVGREHLTVVGTLPFISIGDNAKFTGHYTVHAVYGEQFVADYYETVAPKTVAAILRYLSSGIIKGVGPATAERIVEKFGDKTFEILENELVVAEQQLVNAGKELTASRIAAAKHFEKAVSEALSFMDMNSVQFIVKIVARFKRN